MVSAEGLEVARKGEEIYQQRLREQLEKTHRGMFVAIEPASGDYYIGRTLEEASAAARQAHPGQLMYGLRVGFPSVVEFGYAYDDRPGR